MKSAMIVPLTLRGRAFGALSFVNAESRRAFDESDLAFAQDVARRVAFAIEHARAPGS